MRRILAPHNEQDGWVYVRVAKGGSLIGVLGEMLLWLRQPGSFPCGGCGRPSRNPLLDGFAYRDDDYPNSRIISSSRVEEAVETADYLKRCEEEGLNATRYANLGEWWVKGCFAPTLREAYHRYINAKEDS